MNLEHVFSTLLLIISYKVMCLTPNVLNPLNETYTLVQSDQFVNSFNIFFQSNPY